MMVMMADGCDSIEKLDEVYKYGGDQCLTAVGQQEAIVSLEVVFSRIRYLISKMPYDATILNQPIQIIIYHRGMDKVAGGSGVPSWLTSVANQFVEASFHVRTGVFQNNQDSIKQDLMLNPSLSYSYQWLYPQCSQYRFQGSVSPSQSQITLTGFKAGDLYAIQLYCVKESDIIGTSGVANDVLNAYGRSTDLGNLLLTYQGQVLYDTRGIRLAKVSNAIAGLKPSFIPSSALVQGTATGPFSDVGGIKSYYYTIDFTLMGAKSSSDGAVVAHGLRNVQNASMVLQFSTPDTSNYILFVSYLYPCSARAQGGNCEFIF